MRKLLPELTAVAALFLTGGGAISAPINWAPVVDIESVEDISQNGFLVEAKNATIDGLSPVVLLPDGEPILFEAMGFPTTTTNTAGFFTRQGGTTGSFELDQVMDSQAFGGPGWEFHLFGLEIGDKYQVQVIAGGDTRGLLADVNQRAGDAETSESISADMRRGGVGSAIGTFIANSAVQRIRMHEGIINPQLPAVSGYVLRILTPLPPTDVALSHTRIDSNSVAGSFIGTLSASDPNVGDAHTFALADTENHPDNGLFVVAFGDQLRALIDLGDTGTNYTINVRATDGEALSIEKEFELTVEDVPPISTVTYTGATLRLTMPIIPDRRIAINYSPELSQGTWLDLGNFFESDGEMVFNDPDPLRLSRSKGYYRAVLRPLLP